MLLKQDVLEGIRSGQITMAFRRWKRPTVKTGGTLLTALGQLRIEKVVPVEPGEITEAHAVHAGFASLGDLLVELDGHPGRLYRIEFGRIGADPRIALRSDDDLSEDDVATLTAKLDRLDRTATHGPRTRQTMRLIAEHPHVRAPDLAASVGRETLPFKDDVRKLKALGLTISHSPGYELSPRGHELLRRLEA